VTAPYQLGAEEAEMQAAHRVERLAAVDALGGLFEAAVDAPGRGLAAALEPVRRDVPVTHSGP
jgi:hypothetical protein